MIYLLFLVCTEALFFELKGSAERCFSLHVGTDSEFRGAFVVSGDGDQNVIARVTSETGKVQYQSPLKSREGSFALKSKGGTHKLCFRATDFAPKTVSFEFTSDDQIEEEKLASEEGLIPLRDSMKDLSKKLDIVYRNLHFYERREKINRDLTERTCDRVLWSSLLKMLVIVFLSGAQIYILRGLFSSKFEERI